MLMVIIEPFAFMPGQHLRYYGVSVEWAESYAFKGQKVTVLYAQKFVFQPYAELAFDVTPGSSVVIIPGCIATVPLGLIVLGPS